MCFNSQREYINPFFVSKVFVSFFSKKSLFLSVDIINKRNEQFHVKKIERF